MSPFQIFFYCSQSKSDLNKAKYEIWKLEGIGRQILNQDEWENSKENRV